MNYASEIKFYANTKEAKLRASKNHPVFHVDITNTIVFRFSFNLKIIGNIYLRKQIR